MQSSFAFPTPKEITELNELTQTMLSWGLIKDHPELLISSPMDEQSALNATKRINKSFFSSDIKASHYLKSLDSMKHPNNKFTVVFNRGMLNLKEGKQNTSSGAKDAAQPQNTTETKEHPIGLLNKREITDADYVQKKLVVQLQRALNFQKSEAGNSRWGKTDDSNPASSFQIDHEFSEEYGLSTSAGLSKEINDDYYYFFNDLKIKSRYEKFLIPFRCIFDGHGKGGGIAGGYLAENITDILKQSFEVFFQKLPPPSNEDYAKKRDLAVFNILKLSFVELSNKIQKEEWKVDGGSTATLCLFVGDEIWTACSGDSRAMISFNENEESLTIPLSYDAKAKYAESGFSTNIKSTNSLKNRGGELYLDHHGHCRVKNAGLNMTHALGHHFLYGINPRPKITKIKRSDYFGRDARLVIATDGLWDVVNCQQAGLDVQNAIKAGIANSEISLMLMSKALRSGSRDNITVFVTSIDGINATIKKLRVEAPLQNPVAAPLDCQESDEPPLKRQNVAINFEVLASEVNKQRKDFKKLRSN